VCPVTGVLFIELLLYHASYRSVSVFCNYCAAPPFQSFSVVVLVVACCIVCYVTCVLFMCQVPYDRILCNNGIFLLFSIVPIQVCVTLLLHCFLCLILSAITVLKQKCYCLCYGYFLVCTATRCETFDVVLE
jgi:hypothetical protein